jgi:hypothetical protein
MVEYSDFIVAVNGVDLTPLSFDEGLDVMVASSWPQTVVFKRQQQNEGQKTRITKKRQKEILNMFLTLKQEQKNDKGAAVVGGGGVNGGSSRGSSSGGSSGGGKKNDGGEQGETKQGAMPTWKEMLHAHTKDQMSLDETLEAIHLMEHHDTIGEESIVQLQQRLAYFITSWEEGKCGVHNNFFFFFFCRL